MQITSRLINRLRRNLRPLVHSFRDKKRVESVGKDVARLLPMLANYEFNDDDVVIDLGANRGDFSIWSLRKGAFVIGFEPHPEAFDYYTRRTKSIKKIIRMQVAISNKTELGQIYVHPHSGEDQLGFSIRASTKVEKLGFIPYSRALSINIDEIFNSIEKITLLKVDIEGSEFEIWPSIAENADKIMFLLMEIHDAMNPLLRQQIEKFIENRGLSKRWTASWV